MPVGYSYWYTLCMKTSFCLHVCVFYLLDPPHSCNCKTLLHFWGPTFVQYFFLSCFLYLTWNINCSIHIQTSIVITVYNGGDKMIHGRLLYFILSEPK